MKEKDISDLIRRYNQMLESGRSIYFDAEEFDDLAEYYDMLDDIEEAEKIVEAGLKIHPGNHFLMLKSAKFIIYRGQYNKAIEYLDNTFDGYDFELYLLKIECLLQLELYSEANNLVQEVMCDDEIDKDVLFSELGFIYAETDYHADAITFFEKSLKYDSTNIEVLTELAYSYEMCSDFANAVITTNRILDIDPYSCDAWVSIGKLHSLQDEYEKAVDAFDFALTISEAELDVLKLKAHCLSLCDRTEEAISLFKECLVDNPYDESLYYSLAECYFSCEMYDEMLGCLNKYQELCGETAEIYAKKALAYLQKDQKDRAYEMLKQGMALDPFSDDINIVAGELHFQLGEFIKAEAFFLNAFENNQENASVLDRLSLINISKNDINKAILYTEYLVALNVGLAIKIRLALLCFEADDKAKFNAYIDTFSDEELRSLIKLFFSEDQFDLSSINRDMLIVKLNDARECRQLFKNIAH